MNSPVQPSVAITGGSGYLGGRLAAHLVGKGWRVRILGRRPTAMPGTEFAKLELGQEIPAGAFDGVDALVHCAWDFGKRSWSDIERVNVRGSQRLFDAAAEAGVKRLVNVSTVSASGEPRSMYGRAKLATESSARERGAAIVRPGLLYGPEPGGMVGLLSKLVSGLPVVPVLVGACRPLYLAHEDDVCALLRAAAEGREGSEGPVVAAARDPHTLRTVLEAIAHAKGRRRAYLRVPWQAVYVALRGLELARVPIPMRADSALSIGTLDPDPFGSAAPPREIPFRPFDASVLGDREPVAG